MTREKLMEDIIKEFGDKVIGDCFAGGLFKDNKAQKMYTSGYKDGFNSAKNTTKNFLKKALTKAYKEGQKSREKEIADSYNKALGDMFIKIAELAEPDERQPSAGDLHTNMDNIHEIRQSLSLTKESK